MKVLFLYPNIPQLAMLPAAIGSLNGYLKANGVETSLFDTTYYRTEQESTEEYRQKICQIRPFNYKENGMVYKNTDMVTDFHLKIFDFQPDIIAITANDFTHNIAEKLINGIHRWYRKDVHVIMGGIYPTFFPEFAIYNPDIDSICIGEGHEALLEICQIHGKKQSQHIQNLWIKYDDKVHKNPIRRPIDINTLPFDDYDIFDEERFYRPMHGQKKRMINVWLDIGCPYNCTYCAAPQLKKLYENNGYLKAYLRIKNMDRLRKEMRHMVDKYKPNYIYFSTETFFARPEQHIQEFTDFYASEIHLPCWVESRVETINDNHAECLKKMGCDRISMGLESGNENYRRKYLNKTFTNEQFINAVSTLQKHGLKLTINNIMGLPDDTREGMFDTIALNHSIMGGPTDISMTVTIYSPCGGSGLQKYCLKKGYYNLHEYINMPYGSFHRDTWLHQPHISADEIRGIYRCFPLYVKFPLEKYPLIKKAETDDEVFQELSDEYWKN